jgi:tyrosine-protein phosphatase SIW14
MSLVRHSLLALLFLSVPVLAGSPEQGIKNFHQVDAHVYRGAQPPDDGFRYLAKIGVKTVLDLRESRERSTREAKIVASLGMRYVNVPMSGFAPPTRAEISKILALLEDPASGPVFVHCWRGADRTGSVIAAYRIDHDHWDNARALKEARSYGLTFYQIPRENFIRNFQPLKAEERAKTSGGVPNRMLVASPLASVSP